MSPNAWAKVLPPAAEDPFAHAIAYAPSVLMAQSVGQLKHLLHVKSSSRCAHSNYRYGQQYSAAVGCNMVV